MNNINLTFEYITKELKKIENSGTEKESEIDPITQKTVYEIIESFIEVNNLISVNGTTKHRKSALKKLKSFFGKKIPKFTDFNYQFYLEYTNWLLENDLENSSVNKQFCYLRTFMGYASKLGLYDMKLMKDFDSLPEAEKRKIYISKDELKKIWEHEFESEKLERIKDLFVFGCATGLRESDFSEIKPENIQKEEFSLISIKLKKLLVIPFNFYSREVLKKYNNCLPKYSQQKFNDYIKEALQKIGLDNPEQVVTYKKGIRKEEVVPKYSLVSSHTARRTFITQSILRGIPTPVIQTITGHSDLRSFSKYIKITSTDKQTEMLKWED